MKFNRLLRGIALEILFLVIVECIAAVTLDRTIVAHSNSSNKKNNCNFLVSSVILDRDFIVIFYLRSL